MWTKLDDRANKSAKLNSLSDAAYRLWAIVLIESRQPEHLWRVGHVPREVLPVWVQNRWRGARLAKLAEEIVEATAGGKSGLGLWEPREDGWQIHDWHQYGPPEKPERPTLGPKELGKIGGKASAQSRRAKHGTAVPERAKNRPKAPEALRGVLAEAVPEAVRANDTEAVPEALPEATEAPDPDPDPDLKSPKPSFEPLRVLRPRAERVTAEQIEAALEMLQAQ